MIEIDELRNFQQEIMQTEIEAALRPLGWEDVRQGDDHEKLLEHLDVARGMERRSSVLIQTFREECANAPHNARFYTVNLIWMPWLTSMTVSKCVTQPMTCRLDSPHPPNPLCRHDKFSVPSLSPGLIKSAPYSCNVRWHHYDVWCGQIFSAKTT